MADEKDSAEFIEIEQNAREIAQPQEQFFREKTSAFGSEQKPSKIQMIKDFLLECKRVLLITKKPDKEELKTIVKISGLGILLIGLMGFLIHLVKELAIS